MSVTDFSEVLGHRHLIMASDRGPAIYSMGPDGCLRADRGNGGLVTALTPIVETIQATWLFSGTTEGMRAPVDQSGDSLPKLPGQRASLKPVDIASQIYEPFYNVASTKLWLLHHGMFSGDQDSTWDESLLDSWCTGYVPVNEAFAQAIVDEAAGHEESPLLLIQDIHLYLVARLVRETLPDAKILHFVHPPWPSPKFWKALPHDITQSIFDSLLHVDILGLQTNRDVDAFLKCVATFAPQAKVRAQDKSVEYRGRVMQVTNYPVAASTADLERTAVSSAVREQRCQLNELRNEHTVVRVDRVDPIKNIPAGFRAFGQLLELHPEFHAKVNFIACLVPGPSDIPEYAACKREIDQEVDAVNRRFGRDNWTPVTVFYEDNYHRSIAALIMYDVLLVNPITDGMNLVSKEGSFVNQKDGVLVLSATAGAYGQLQEGAIPIEPHDIEGTASAIYRALTMSSRERKTRSAALRQAVSRDDVADWLRQQVLDLLAL